MKALRKHCIAILACAASGMAGEIPFEGRMVAGGLRGGYQVVAADMNRDNRPDLLVVASGLADLVWFENPGTAEGDWKKHVIATGFSRMINAAVQDLDDDGIPEIALAAEFAMDPSKSAGIVYLLRHGKDAETPWSILEIDRISTAHRLRWADIDGSGQRVLINAPLAAAEARIPLYEGQTPLVFYRQGAWKREIIGDENQGVVHGILIDGSAILTASFSGLHRYQHAKGKWHRTEIAKGAVDPCPKCGSSDVAVGVSNGSRFHAAIEPWHGNQVVVYRDGQRLVIDNTILDGHNIATADFDSDGRSEIVAGYRGKDGKGGVILYREDGPGKEWQRQVIDATLPAAGCAVADFNRDQRPDIACVGSASATLKLYENRLPRQ